MSHEQQKWNRDEREEHRNGEARKETVEHSSYLHTDVRVQHPHLPAPIISSAAGFAKELLGEGFHVNVSRISGNSQENQVIESPAMTAEMQRDYEEKIKEQEKLNKEFEKELEKRTEAYRKQQEAATEQIRKQLEQQHLKDVAFRQELVEVAIENQKKQVDIEVRYAKRDLDHQRKMAKDTLERTKFSQEIQVTLDTAAGSSVSGSSTHVEKRKEGHQAY